MKKYYYSDRFKTEGETLGPLAIEELEQLYLQTQITEECKVCEEGSEQWRGYLEILAEVKEEKRKEKIEEKEKKDTKRETSCLLLIIGCVFSGLLCIKYPVIGLVSFIVWTIISLIIQALPTVSRGGGGNYGGSASGGCGVGGSDGGGGCSSCGGGCGGCGGGG